MAQIIKGTEKPTPPAPRSRLIKAALFQEELEIKALLEKTEKERQQIITSAKPGAAHAKEQAMTEGANLAFAELSEEAVRIFVDRAKYCLDLKGQLKRLSDAISQKILGGSLFLKAEEQDKILDASIKKLRSRRKIKIQLANKQPLESIGEFPEFEIEAASNLPEGFLRVVTEISSSLWEEKLAVPKILELTHELH